MASVVSAGMGVYKVEKKGRKVAQAFNPLSSSSKDKDKKKKKKSKTPLPPGKLVVRVIEARNLKAADMNGKSDPYCFVEVGKYKEKTATIKKNLNPKWDQEFTFECEGTEKDIKIRVFDHDRLTMDDSIGRMETKIKYFLDGNLVDDWFDLTKKGQIRLQVRFTPIFEGKLNVTVVEADQLRSADLIGKSDPYVVIKIGKQKRRTKTKIHTLKPKWNETFKFDVDEDHKELYLMCADRDIIGVNDKLGECTVQLDYFDTGAPVDDWFDFHPKGRVHLRLQYESQYATPFTEGYTETEGIAAAPQYMGGFEDLVKDEKEEGKSNVNEVISEGVYIPGEPKESGKGKSKKKHHHHHHEKEVRSDPFASPSAGSKAAPEMAGVYIPSSDDGGKKKKKKR